MNALVLAKTHRPAAFRIYARLRHEEMRKVFGDETLQSHRTLSATCSAMTGVRSRCSFVDRMTPSSPKRRTSLAVAQAGRDQIYRVITGDPGKRKVGRDLDEQMP